MTKKKRINKYCFNCGKMLDFRYFITSKSTEFTEKEKLEIWNNKKCGLFCCNCYSHFITKTLKIRNRRIEQIYSGSKIEPEQKTLKDIIRSIDPIDYRTLERF